jgi:Raf kinase inhibitor-like YbhB/YbcL family protein
MRIVAIALLIPAAALAACAGPSTGTGGAGAPTLASPPTPAAAGSPSAATSDSTASTASAPTKEPVMPLILSSTAFADGGSIPREHTCDGADISPPLAWTGIPDGTAAIALIVDDPDAGGFVHWVAYDIDPALDGLAAGASVAADAPPQGQNSFGQVGYGGPCPPSGTHHYVFRLLALDRPAAFRGGTPTADSVINAASGHVISEARLTGTYDRGH